MAVLLALVMLLGAAATAGVSTPTEAQQRRERGAGLCDTSGVE
ncbi:MAG: hypothetical protein OXK16_12665 [bacterium]|nr:hypothetical protein [bacterium]